MKRINKIIASSATLVLLLAACGLDDLTKDFNVHLDPTVLEHTAMVRVYDPVDQTQLIDGLSITFKGDAANQIYDVNGGKELIIQDGFVSFGLHPDLNASDQNPVLVKMELSAPGYYTRKYEFAFTDEKKHQFNLAMMHMTQLPEGVATKESSFALAGGATSQAEKITVDAGPNKEQGLEIELPAGTSFFDKQGNPLTGTNLEAVVMNFDSQTEMGEDMMPAGSTIDSVILPDGTVESIQFETAAIADIDMTVDGVTVRDFSQPVKLTAELSDTLVNPETGATITAGDSIEVWSYSHEGKWEYEGKSVIVNDGGTMKADYDATHLCWYRWSWRSRRCSNYARITINSNAAKVAVIRVSNPYSWWWNRAMFAVYLSPGQNNFYVYKGSSRGLQVGVYENYSDAYYNRNRRGSAATGGCGNITVNAIFPSSNPDVTLDLSAYCPDNPNALIRPDFYVFYQETGQSGWDYLGAIQSGYGVTNKLEQGTSYKFLAFYDGWNISPDTTITKTYYKINFELGPDRCQ